MDDPYQVLGLEPQATEEQIRQRYLELVRRHPPEQDPQRFAAIRQAYDALRDPVTLLRQQLFETVSHDSVEKIIALLREQQRRQRLPTDLLLSLGER